MKLNTISIILLIIFGFVNAGAENELTHQEFRKKFIENCLEIDEGFSNPNLEVDESGIYIIDKKHCMIYIFEKNDGRKIKVIGRRGEGPGEFLYISDLHFSKDFIFVSSPPKLTVFSKDGKFLYEKRTNLSSYGGGFIPFGENYLYRRYNYELTGKSYLTYTLLDKNLKEIKTFFKTPYSMPRAKNKYKTPFLVFHDCRKDIVYKDKIYIGNTELGFYIAVIDINGNKLYEINRDYKKISIDSSLKNKIMKYIKSTDPNRAFLSRREVIFQEYFPAFVNFFIHDDKIFVFRFSKPGEKGGDEIVLLDLNGNIIGQKKIPLGPICEKLQNPHLTSFYKGDLYFLYINDENTTICKLSLDELYNHYFVSQVKWQKKLN
ncbi:MAG: 6-bladed beta-propeller [Candidatus Aminicenantes bacterium]|jgi:hypothetical protein